MAALLRRCLGDVPHMEGLSSWEQALGPGQELRLFFEVSLPTPPEYQQLSGIPPRLRPGRTTHGSTT